MYEKNGKTITLEQAEAAAKRLNLSIEDWVAKTGYVEVGGGKQNGSTEMTPTEEPLSTPAGDSSSGDISLGSPKIDFNITAADLAKSEEDLVPAINKLLSKYGLYASESTAFGSLDAISIKKRETEFEGPSTWISAPLEIFSSIKVGANKSKSELEESARQINELVANLGDTSYLSKAQDILGNKWENYKTAVDAPDMSQEELKKDIEKARLDKFEKIRAKYNKINANKFRGAGANQNIKIEEPRLEEDFANEKEYQDYLAWQKGDVLSVITEDNIALYDAERRDSYMRTKSTEFSSDMSLNERQALDALVDNKIEVREQNLKNYENKFKAAQKEGERVQELIDSYKKSPDPVSYEILIESLDNLKNIEDTLNKSRIALNKEGGDAKYLLHATNALKADYNRLRQMRTVFKSMGADVLYLGAQLDEMMGVAGDKEMEFVVTLGEDLRKEQAGYQEDLTVEDAFDSTKNFGRWVAGAGTNLIPSLSLAMTGPAALPLFFMTGAGGRGMEFAIEEKNAAQRLAKNKRLLEENPGMDDFERAFIEQEMDKDAETLNIPEWRKLSTQFIYGVAEVAFERVGTLKILDDVGRAAKMLPPTSIKEGAKRIGSTYGSGFFREGGSEWATTVTGNIADIYLIGEDKNVFEGSLESFAQGALMGGGMVSVNTPRLVKEALSGELATRSENKRLNEIMQRISELTGQNIQNIDANALGAFGSLTPEVRKMVEELTLEADGIKDGILEGLAQGRYNAADLKQIGDANREMRRINKEFSAAVASGQFSPAQLKAMEAEYRQKHDAAFEARNEILEGETNIEANLALAARQELQFNAQEGYALYELSMLAQSKLTFNNQFDALSETSKQELYSKVREQLGENADADAIKREARKQFVDEKFRGAINKGIENAKRFAEGFGEDMPTIESFDGETATEDYLSRLKELGFSAAEIKTAKENLEKGITEAVNIKRNGQEAILIHVPNSVKNGRIGVAAHEVLHAVARRKFKDANEAGKELLGYLEKNQPDLFARVKFRIDQSYSKKGIDGEIELDKDYYEEAMNAMSDVLADGVVIAPEALSKIRVFLNSLAPKIINLKSDEATYHFVKGFNKQAHFGGKSSGINIQGRTITPKDEDSEKESKSLLSDINALVPESVETQADFFDRKVFNPIYNDGNLHPAIANYIRSRSVSKEEAQKIIDSVADRLINFNPEATRKSGDAKITFGEFLFANVNFGKLDARKALFEESQERAQTESTDSEQARQVVAADATTALQAEAPVYKNLLKRRVLEPGVVDAIKAKVMSTVRVMKTRMDESVSKNVTVKPYIAELRKAMGKQADIDLKKAMGGLKDGQLRKFLLKNKTAILENMTTTWLMTAMPNAVQKKVDGQWTSDWKGKKIDRETVGTDSAGRTSGAEMVRRLPKAATRMSDADFLSNFLNADGSLIRGRKESLAKAMAEEISFDIINEALQDPNSEIRQAFEMRQDLLGVELFDNYITEVRRDIERGNVKFSKTFNPLNDQHVKRARDLYAEVKKQGIDNVIDENGNLLYSYAEDYSDVDGIGKWMREADRAGVLIGDIKSFGFQQRTLKSNIISQEVKDATKKGLASDRENLPRKKKMAAGMKKLADKLGRELVNALNIEIFGSHYRYLDSAKIKQDTGKPADFYEWAEGIKNTQTQTTLVSEDIINSIELMNSSFGIMKQIHTNILSKAMPVEEKIKALEKYKDRIEAANFANKEVYKAVMGALYDLYVEGEIDGEVVQQFFQMQTSLKAGLRALTSLSYITITADPMVHPKGEHLADNASTSFEIMEKLFESESKIEFLSFVSDKLQFHDQWLEEVAVTKVVDIFNPNNQTLDLRIFGSGRVDNIYSIDGRPAREIIEERKSVINRALAFNKNINWAEWAGAVEAMEPQTKYSQSVPRAVFMVGGPGAGKTNVGKGLKLGRRGYKVINQDLALEPMKEEAGLPANEQQYTKEQRSMRAKLGAAARKAAEAKMEKYLGLRESMVVDGTGASYNATMKKINALREAGYEVSIVFANTSKEEAIARNKARAERALPDMIVERTWEAVQESAKLYKEEFGNKFYELNTNELKLGEDLPKPFLDKLYKDLEVGEAKYSKSVSKEFNEILERKTGVASYKEFSRIQAQLRGKKKGRFKFFIHPSADDFRGLVHYAFAGKGKQGEADMAWLEEKLLTPYFRGVAAIDAMRQQIKRDFKVVTKQFREEYKLLSKQVGNSGFTHDHALRVYMWDRQGMPIEGLAKRDKTLLLDAIAKNPELVELADALLVVSRRNEWPEPTEYWEGGSILGDLNSMTEKIGRKKFLAEFIENAEIIFSEENLNKIEALFGSAHREAIEDSLYSMKNGTNRRQGTSKQVGAWLNWVNGSTEIGRAHV